ncbi:uncharacterized protein LOC110819721 [Carica papaya]|uniref:uncharacterized protein LOC110819721 n=1 Tax=Carica papaya TaxID=3649 RepID=UPI000B8CC2D9|nr:uncharacterized protein LOC110819721 [Carica papaya]
MANARLARFVMEVAPPQFVTVMRHKTAKLLDTINEEEREFSGNDSVPSSRIPPSNCAAATAAATAGAAAGVAAVNCKNPLREVQRSLSIFRNYEA